MSFYDPKIYNYSNLTDEDKSYVDFASNLICSIDDMTYDYKVDYDTQSTLERIETECTVKAIGQAIERQLDDLVEFIVSRIDGYAHDVEKVETDNYFYGSNLIEQLKL